MHNYMKAYLLRIIIIVVFSFSHYVCAQNTSYNLKSQINRINFIKNYPNSYPLIVYDQDTLSVEDFFSLEADSIDEIRVLSPDTASFLYGKAGEVGAVQIWSKNLLWHLMMNESLVETSSNRPLFRQIEKTALLQLASKLLSCPIMIDGKEMGIQDFLCFPDEDIDELELNLNPRHTKGDIVIKTKAYMKEMNIGFRKHMVKQFRVNELEVFFGLRPPIFKMDGLTITEKEFLSLDEDSISFINYYMTDFVKHFYGNNGLVYCLKNQDRRNTNYRDIPKLPIPLEGRAHIDNYDWYPTVNMDINSFAREWLDNHQTNISFNDSVKVMVSCLIGINGKITPIVVTDIEHYETFKKEELNSLVEVAIALIGDMPKWEPVYKDGELVIAHVIVTLLL